MQHKGHNTLSRNTALFVLFICISVVALEMWHEWTQRELTITHSQEDALNLASSLAQQADVALAAMDGTLTTTAATLLPSEDNLGTSHLSWLFAVNHGPGAHTPPTAIGNPTMADPRSGRIGLPVTVMVFDEAGQLIAANQPMPPLTLGASFPDLETRLQKSSSLQTQLSTPVKLPISGEWGLAMSRIVLSTHGTRAGTVVATVPSSFFSSFYKQFITNWTFSVGLVTRDGYVVASGVDAEALIGGRVPEAEQLGALLATAPSGPMEGYTEVTRSDISGAFVNLSRYQLAIIATSQLDAVLIHWRRDGAIRFLLSLTFALAIGLLGFWLSDQIRRRQEGEAVLAEREAEFRLLTESASDVVERYSLTGDRLYVSPAIERLTGYTSAERLGTNAFDVINPDDRPAVMSAARRLTSGQSDQETVTFRAQHRDGRELWLESSLRHTVDGQAVVGVTRDVTARKQIELRLEAMANVDGLTGLANRRAFDRSIALEAGRARRLGQPLSLLMIDTDHFKRFNDDYGHLAGDTALKAIAAVITGFARRPDDVAARYGGEEMALLLPRTSLDDARAIAQELSQRVERLAIPHVRNLPWGVATVSIGVATLTDDDPSEAQTAQSLIARADLALYEAKSQGRNQVIFSRPMLTDRQVG